MKFPFLCIIRENKVFQKLKSCLRSFITAFYQSKSIYQWDEQYNIAQLLGTSL